MAPGPAPLPSKLAAACPKCPSKVLKLYSPGFLHGLLSSSSCHICNKPFSRSARRWKCGDGSCSFCACTQCVVVDRAVGPVSLSASPLTLEFRVPPPPPPKPTVRPACRYGASCYQIGPEHMERFAHPGDRDYACGRVTFDHDRRPDLSTLWQIFTFFDERQSGHLSMTSFELAALEVATKAEQSLDISAAWQNVGGAESGFVGFVRFAAWAGRLLPGFPVGLDPGSGGFQKCRLLHPDGQSCGCDNFVAAAATNGRLCLCGHRAGLHRSEMAEGSLAMQLLSSKPLHWQRGVTGLVEITEPELLHQLQFLLDATHKEKDNWTRDRGCALHGVDGCKPPCVYQNRQPVPSGYRLIQARRNQNCQLWARYVLTKAAILQECKLGGGCSPLEVESSSAAFRSLAGVALDGSVNEWRLFHGTSHTGCLQICDSNFNLSKAGTGATWKDASGGRGLPLYGRGIYCAERITKADEYAKPMSASERRLNDLPDGRDLYSVLVCRAVGGRATVVTSNEIDATGLRAKVIEGPHHSVLGDRVKDLGKPFREMVLYDRDQVYPEFVLTYERIMTG
eukprot:TRINITY_DN31494_c0_g1_i1.p1 TRINITY_DN31494_c0_g1~~TRINITY_DN31494_c0_g1_i1.p1  ORF type:complete len:566 (+),score=82.61 TRINITY_DN31494_c0_g1_i1:90-1787(+)